MAEGNEPRPSSNWIEFYNHKYNDATVTLPNNYNELLFVAFASSFPNGNAYTIIINKEQFIEMPDGYFLRAGYYQADNDYGAWAVRKDSNTIINPRRISFTGVSSDDTYIRLMYR